MCLYAHRLYLLCTYTQPRDQLLVSPPVLIYGLLQLMRFDQLSLGPVREALLRLVSLNPKP